MLGGLTRLVTLRAMAWEEGARPIHAPHELDEEIQAPRCIQRVLPAGTKLRVHGGLLYGYCLQYWGSPQLLLAKVGAQLRSWAGLQVAAGCCLELSLHLSGQGGNGGVMEAGLDGLLPALIEALAPVAAFIHTLELSYCSHQLGATMSASLVRTLPSLRNLHVFDCRLHESMVAPLAQLRQLRLLPLSARMRQTGACWLLPWQLCWLTEGRCWRGGVERAGSGWSGWSIPCRDTLSRRI